DDVQAELLRGASVRRRDAEAVGLLVVEDVDLLQAELLREHRVRRTLDLIVRHDAGVVALSGRVVLQRLTGLGAWACRRETRAGVRRAHHAEWPLAGPHRAEDLR